MAEFTPGQTVLAEIEVNNGCGHYRSWQECKFVETHMDEGRLRGYWVEYSQHEIKRRRYYCRSGEIMPVPGGGSRNGQSYDKLKQMSVQWRFLAMKFDRDMRQAVAILERCSWWSWRGNVGQVIVLLKSSYGPQKKEQAPEEAGGADTANPLP